ncbi:uncharacterized protein LOC114188320 [Vigna unguiculata]|uniref:uncharacterized protein LOC114188320 n=1 Tax=Vigna unguiculata TaxID=3917 RepID=UPI0010161FB4|nr:uncharacterized protein LOC114188320 [Vigna unguiculata]
MARKFDWIKEIDEKKETLKLVVRVKDLWFVQNWDMNRHMELILLDQKGDMIPTMVKKEDIGLWEEKLVEGHTYIMHNFKIMKNQGQFRKFNDFVFMVILVLYIIGVVDNVRCNPQSKNVVFHIRDLSSAVIGCTLWDSYYFKFMSNWRGEPDSFIIVVMLTQAKIKPSSGQWPVSISNSWNGSKLLMGDECSELVRFKEQWIQYTFLELLSS